MPHSLTPASCSRATSLAAHPPHTAFVRREPGSGITRLGGGECHRRPHISVRRLSSPGCLRRAGRSQLRGRVQPLPLSGACMPGPRRVALYADAALAVSVRHGAGAQRTGPACSLIAVPAMTSLRIPICACSNWSCPPRRRKRCPTSAPPAPAGGALSDELRDALRAEAARLAGIVEPQA